MLKSIYLLLLTLWVSALLPAQSFHETNNNIILNMKERSPFSLSYSPRTNRFFNPQSDTAQYNAYGDLLNDDPKYNKKYPLWMPALKVVQINIFTWAIDRYVLNEDY